MVDVEGDFPVPDMSSTWDMGNRELYEALQRAAAIITLKSKLTQ